MSRYSDTLTDENGRAIADAKVYVYTLDQKLAALEDDGGLPLSNPVSTDAYGGFFFNTNDGVYDLDYWVSGRRRWRERKVQVGVGPALPDEIVSALLAPGRAAQIGSSGASNVQADLDAARTFTPAGVGAVARTIQDKLRSLSVSPEDFGAVGDGVTDDSDAFSALSTFVSQAGGGTIELGRGKTYRIGKQTRNGMFGPFELAYAPQGVLVFDGLTKSLTIRGNGARIKALDGYRYGAFDPATGNAYASSPGFLTPEYQATPYYGMIDVNNCTAPVLIENIELDGNVAKAIFGGVYGNTGRQINAAGVNAYGNAQLTLINVNSHDHPYDGALIGYDGQTATDPARPVVLMNCQFNYNTRQGLSWVGGRGLTAIGCSFSHTGRRVNIAAGSAFNSAPAAGVDIEAESAVIRSGMFMDCEFVDNVGVGMVCNTGDCADVSFKRSRFVGTTYYAAWPAKPGFSFEDCEFLGGVVNTYASTNLTEIPKFRNCLFTGAVSRSPTGAVYSGAPLFEHLSLTPNAVLDDCRIDTGGNTALVAVAVGIGVTMRNVHIKQDGTGEMTTSCIWEGENNSLTYPGGVTINNTFQQVWGYYTINGVVQRQNRTRTLGAVDASEVKAGAAELKSDGVYVSGNKVVGARGAAIASPTGGVTIDTEARAAIDLILARMRAATPSIDT